MLGLPTRRAMNYSGMSIISLEYRRLLRNKVRKWCKGEMSTLPSMKNGQWESDFKQEDSDNDVILWIVCSQMATLVQWSTRFCELSLRYAYKRKGSKKVTSMSRRQRQSLAASEVREYVAKGPMGRTRMERPFLSTRCSHNAVGYRGRNKALPPRELLILTNNASWRASRRCAEPFYPYVIFGELPKLSQP